MAASVSAVGLLIILLPCSLSEDRINYVGRVVNALENVVNYYKLNYQDLNVDGLFGLRVVEGQLELLLQEYNQHGRHHNLSTDIVSKLEDMKSASTVISNKAVQYVRQDDEEYFQKLKYVVGKPWDFLKTHKELQNQLRWSPQTYLEKRNTKLDEDFSDRCMGELIGTTADSKGKACQISDFCIKLMTTKGLSGYGITHQLLWTMLAEQHGCKTILDSLLTERGRQSLDSYREEFCANNFYEMTEFIHNHLQGTISPKFQDLFLEQQFVCPNLGYYQFLSYSYLDQILSWQKSSGCYGVMSRSRMQGSSRNTNESKFSDLTADYSYDEDLHGDAFRAAAPAGQEHDVSDVGLDAAKNVVKGNNSVENLGDAKFATGGLKRVDVGKLGPPDANLIAPNAKIQQNGNVVIQTGHGLVGKFTPVVKNDVAASNFKKNTAQVKSAGNVVKMDSENLHPAGNVVVNQAVVPLKSVEMNQDQKRGIGGGEVSMKADGAGKLNNSINMGNKNIQDANNIIPNQNPPAINRMIQTNELVFEQAQGNRRRRLLGASRGDTVNRHIGRRLLAEKAMREGCLAHKTAVAAGALVMYLRYLIDPGPMDIQRNIVDPSQHRFLMSRETGKHSINRGNGKKHQNRQKEDLVNSFKAGLVDVGHLRNGNGPKLRVEEDGNAGNLENILNAQLNLNNEDGDENYYAQDGNDDDGYDDKKKEGLYNQNEDKKHLLVQFDNGNGPVINANVGHKADVHDGYGDDVYKDENHNNDHGDGDYDEEKALNAKNDANRVQIGRKPVVPKADETDYTYYDDNEQHNGYNNVNNEAKEDEDVAEMRPKVLQAEQVMEDKTETSKKDVLPADNVIPISTGASPPNTLFLVVCASMLLVVLVMYRFIRSRRVHIRYHPRSFARL